MSDRERLPRVARILMSGTLLTASLVAGGGAVVAQAPSASSAERVLSHFLCR